MKILAFDLGSNMAWATNVKCKLPIGSKKFDGIRTHRLGATLKWLQAFDWANLEAVVYETPFARGRDATRSLWGIAGLIEATATNAGLPVVDVAVPTIKKFATGHGFAAKSEMIIAANRMGYVGTNEHEADALCLLRYAETNLEKVL